MHLQYGRFVYGRSDLTLHVDNQPAVFRILRAVGPWVVSVVATLWTLFGPEGFNGLPHRDLHCS